jgi:hypothetical protein
MYEEKIGRIMGGAMVLYFEILSRHSLGRAEENHLHRGKSIAAPIILGRCPSLSALATNLSRLQRETSKRHVGEAHSVLTTAILLPQRLGCYCKIVSLRMLTNLRLSDFRLATAQQRTTGQNLPSVLYFLVL